MYDNYNIIMVPMAGAGFPARPCPDLSYQLNTSSSSSSFMEKTWLWGSIGSV
jgi:hypothetical protein